MAHFQHKKYETHINLTGFRAANYETKMINSIKIFIKLKVKNFS